MTTRLARKRVYCWLTRLHGGLLLAFPFVAFISLFLLDDPTVGTWSAIARRYLVASAWAYPIYFYVGHRFSRRALKQGKSLSRILIFATVPWLSLVPWAVFGAPILVLCNR